MHPRLFSEELQNRPDRSRPIQAAFGCVQEPMITGMFGAAVLALIVVTGGVRVPLPRPPSPSSQTLGGQSATVCTR